MHVGLWLRLKAKSEKTWTGVFAFGCPSPPAFSRFTSSPDPETVCVVSNGSGYIVNVEKPEAWEQIPTIPVLDVRSLPEQRLFVFANFIRLAACGSNKWAWRSRRLCWDRLKITA
jgi:hypothetical protein